MQHLYKEYRCNKCHKLLFKAILVESVVEVKCKRCSELSTFAGESINEFVCLVNSCPHRVASKLVNAGEK